MGIKKDTDKQQNSYISNKHYPCAMEVRCLAGMVVPSLPLQGLIVLQAKHLSLDILTFLET